MTDKNKHNKSYPSIEPKNQTAQEKASEYNSQDPTSKGFVIPEGYVTGDEFARRVKEGLRKKLQENGYL